MKRCLICGSIIWFFQKKLIIWHEGMMYRFHDDCAKVGAGF